MSLWMAKQRRRDTTAEVEIRRLLHARGLRHRVDAVLPGLPRRRADLTFTSSHVDFVDGCFWHGCPEHKTAPKTNAEWWAARLARNAERDRATDTHLTEGGGWSESGSMRTRSTRRISSRLPSVRGWLAHSRFCRASLVPIYCGPVGSMLGRTERTG